MRPRSLRLKAKPPCQVDASPLVPRGLAAMSPADIAHIRLRGWNDAFQVGDLFAVTGEDPGRLVLADVDGSLCRIGAGLDGGALTVIGQAGDYAGEAMTGGTLEIRGDAGDFLGAGMRGGALACAGNVGSYAGSGRAGELHGMRGGTIVVRGDAGDRTADRMRRGLLLVEGRAGLYCASRMLAGTVVALGPVGLHPGYLMRRGTLVLAHDDAELPPTFNFSGTYELLAFRLLLRSLARYGDRFSALADARFARWVGDLGAAGKGEIFMALT